MTDHFKCIFVNVIYGITCTLCRKIYISETRRKLADRFREHPRDVGKCDTDASKPVTRHFNLPNHSHHMTIDHFRILTAGSGPAVRMRIWPICRLSFHHGNTESCKTLEQKFIFQLSTLYPHGIKKRLSFH